MSRFCAFIDTVSSLPNLIRGTVATATGAVASATPPVAETHWLQFVVMGATIFAGLATGMVALVRLWLDLRKTPNDPPN